MWPPANLVPKDLYPSYHVGSLRSDHKRRNDKIAHLSVGSLVHPRGMAAVWANMHKQRTIYGPLVHVSGLQEGAQPSARRAKYMKNSQTSRTSAHSW